MTKKDLAEEISRRITHIDPIVSAMIVEIVLEKIRVGVARGENVSLYGFGTFYQHVKGHYGLRTRKSMNTLEVMTTPRKPKFKPSPQWTELVRSTTYTSPEDEQRPYDLLARLLHRRGSKTTARRERSNEIRPPQQADVDRSGIGDGA